MEKNNTQKLTANNILKILPKGFARAAVPNKTRIVWVDADLSIISLDDANKAIKDLCKSLSLAIKQSKNDEHEARWMLYDKSFDKMMTAEAKECLKHVKKFFSTYGASFMYSDVVLPIVSQMKQCMNNY